MTSPAARFSAAVETAMGLPSPEQVYRRILASTDAVDNGLRAATYDGRVRGGDPLTHPERMADKRIADRLRRHLQAQSSRIRRIEQDHLIDLRRASDRWLDAISALNAECRDAGTVDTWPDSLWTAQVLRGKRCNNPRHHDKSDHDQHCEQLDTIRAALDLSRPITPWLEKAHTAIVDITAVASRYQARPASALESAWTSGLADEDCCRLCLRFGWRDKKHRRQLCQPHYNLWLESRRHTPTGEPVDPPDWLTEALHRIGGPGKAWQAERSHWLNSLGPERRTA